MKGRKISGQTKRITISLTEELYNEFMRVLPHKLNVSEVLADLVEMFIKAVEEYGEEFILDVIYNRRNFAIRRK